MKKFLVTIREVTFSDFEVEAEDAKQAEENFDNFRGNPIREEVNEWEIISVREDEL